MYIPANHHNLQRPLTPFIGSAIFLIILGILSIIGWLLHVMPLTSVVNNYVTMKFNAALCFMLAGIAFMLLIKYDTLFLKILFYFFTACFGIIGIVTLSQEAFTYSAGIDQFFVVDYNSIALHSSSPGRMSPATAFCFTTLAISFLGIGSVSVAYRKTAQVILHVITFVAFISIIGYLLKVPNAFKFVFFSSMALNTAVGFLVISVAASGINFNLGITSLFTGVGIGNVVARKLFPRMVIILLLLGYISIKIERAHYVNDELGVVLSTVSFILISLFLLWGTLNEMNALEQKRTNAENEIRLLNKNLEDKVLQRTNDLKQSNERFIKILNSSPTCIAITNIQTGKYVDINPALLEMLCFTQDEVIGHTAAELKIISAEFRLYMVDCLKKQGYIKNEETVLKDKYGNDKHCMLSAEILEYNNEKFMMSFVHNITELKIIENNLKETKQNLEVLTDKLTNQNKQLLSFAHIISHNLRSPVANLNLLIHFYKESTSNEDRNDLWGNFDTVVDHLNITLDELLETLKIQEDVEKERETLSFETIFNSVNETLVGQIRESGAIIKTDFSKCGQVTYPKIYLESILLNLISNAIKYRSPDRVPEIMLETSEIGREVTLTVQDNGLGIDLVRHAKNMFGMRKTFHRHAEAKGLGLFITKTQIEAMGGEISVESKVGEGTKFKVVFNRK